MGRDRNNILKVSGGVWPHNIAQRRDPQTQKRVLEAHTGNNVESTIIMSSKVRKKKSERTQISKR